MILGVRNRFLEFWLVAITVLVSINLWSFQLIGEIVYRGLEAIVLFTLLIIVAYHSQILKSNLIFKNNVLLFILLPFMSALAAVTFHNQPLGLSLVLLRF